MTADHALPLLLGLAAGVATFAGGYLTMRLTRLLGIVLGLCAGIVLGVAMLDLVPQALALNRQAMPRLFTMLAICLGAASLLLADHVLPRLTRRARGAQGHLGPASLTLHSLFDGAGIGLAFHLSATTGWSVALAVLTHDLADGINIVGLTLSTSSNRAAWRWLVLNACAPVIGVLLALSIDLSQTALALILGVLSGLFLAIALTELLPRSFRLNGPRRTLATAACGMILVYVWVSSGA